MLLRTQSQECCLKMFQISLLRIHLKNSIFFHTNIYNKYSISHFNRPIPSNSLFIHHDFHFAIAKRFSSNSHTSKTISIVLHRLQSTPPPQQDTKPTPVHNTPFHNSTQNEPSPFGEATAPHTRWIIIGQIKRSANARNSLTQYGRATGILIDIRDIIEFANETGRRMPCSHCVHCRWRFRLLRGWVFW